MEKDKRLSETFEGNTGEKSMKLRKTTIGGFLLTFPKTLATSMGWGDGTRVDFIVKDKDTVLLRRREK